MPINPIAEEIAAERADALAQATANASLMFHAWLLLVVIVLVGRWWYCRRRARRKADFNALRAEWLRHEQQQQGEGVRLRKIN